MLINLILSMKTVLRYFVIISLFLNVSNAMMRFMPQDQLIESSKYIVVVKVVLIEDTERKKQWRGSTARVVKNKLQIVEVIKGVLPQEKLLILYTLKFDNWMEDNVKLPRIGSNVLLFLKINKKGELKPVNSIQGVWYMKNGKFTRIGSKTTLQNIRETVQKPADICLSKKFLSLLDTAEIQTQAGFYRESLKAYRKAYRICPLKDLEEQMAWLMGEIEE